MSQILATENDPHSLLHNRRLAIALAASILAAGPIAAATPLESQPKLVVGIVVEDLRPEYISLLKDHFGPGGFNRLLKNGVVIANADYGTALDPTAATAMIYTGTAPAANGIPAAEIFDRTTLTPISPMLDASAMGNFTNQSLSPAALSMGTITDEVKIAGGGVTYAYAIAPDPTQAMIMAGHAGNCGMWINDAKETWATTTFYKDSPSTLGARNRLKSMRASVNNMMWEPLLGKEDYVLLPEHLTLYPFRYTFRQEGPEKMLAFKASPRVNDEVTEFAIDNIKALSLGQHPGPDMISVAYTVSPYKYSKTGDNRYELLDQYYRLDRNLQTLFDAIDEAAGKDNALIFVAGTPASPESKKEEDRWMMPYGEFSTRKAISLINLYLIALHGNGDWVQAYHNNQFFLNHKLIEANKLKLEDVRSEVARFLERMSGVAKAYTLDEIIDSRSADMAALKRNTHIATAGDVQCYVTPGWQIIDDFNVPGDAAKTGKVVRAAAPTAPIYILAPGITPKTISTPVDARAIAPTITSILRIRSPNGADLTPLSL